MADLKDAAITDLTNLLNGYITAKQNAENIIEWALSPDGASLAALIYQAHGEQLGQVGPGDYDLTDESVGTFHKATSGCVEADCVPVFRPSPAVAEHLTDDRPAGAR